MKKLLLFFFLITPLHSIGQDTLNVMFYNLYRFPAAPPANREYLLRSILDSARPDLLMTCELVTEAGADRILQTAFNDLPDSFARAEFIPGPNQDDPLQQMVFYNTRKLQLIAQTTWPTLVRDINHYLFSLRTADQGADSVLIDVFVTHLKSGTGLGNRQFRLGMVDSFIAALSRVPSGHFVLFAGDFNFYDSGEPGYQRIIDSNNSIQMIDPLNRPGDWHDQPDFAGIHSQATRLTAAGFGIGGASGGMDDRFDFIMMSRNCQLHPAFTYLPGSYRALGNNGDAFNNRLDHLDSYGPYSLSLRQILYNMSDHVPILMQFTTNRHFLTTTPSDGDDPAALMMLPNGNQARDYLTIRFTKTITDRLLVYDLTGKCLQSLPVHPHNKVLRIDLRTFSHGLYFVTLAAHPAAGRYFLKQ